MVISPVSITHWTFYSNRTFESGECKDCFGTRQEFEKRADFRCQIFRCRYSCESTWGAVALLLPCSGWGTTSADTLAAAESTAAHLWTLDRMWGNMGVLTWPADQGCGRHCALQLGGGGEGVGDTPHPQWGATMGQLALGTLGHRREGWLTGTFTGKTVCKTQHQPAWWTDGEGCWLFGQPGGGAGVRMLSPEPASDAETPAALLWWMKRLMKRSCCGRWVRRPAEWSAARFPALAAALWRTQLSACWCARPSEPSFDWRTCNLHRALLRL